MNAYHNLGIVISDIEAEILLGQIRLYVSRSKKTPTNEKLEKLYNDLNCNADERIYANM